MARWALLFIAVMISHIVVITSEFRSDLFVFSPSLNNYDIDGFYEQVTLMSELDCARACLGDDCQTFSYIESTSVCHLYNTWPCNQSAPVQTGRQYYKKTKNDKSVPDLIDCGVQKKDILFLLDSSQSVSDGGFEHEKNFVNHTLSYFNLGADKIQVSVAIYNEVIDGTFALNAYYDVASAQTATSGASRASGLGSSYDFLAFQYAYETVFQPGNGDRADADNVIIFITDGFLIFNQMCMDHVIKFGAETEFFAIGVGNGPPRAKIEELASDPVAEHAFLLETFDDLSAFADTAFTFACSQCPPCLNQGTCERTLGRCLCPPGYIGERCEGCLD